MEFKLLWEDNLIGQQVWPCLGQSIQEVGVPLFVCFGLFCLLVCLFVKSRRSDEVAPMVVLPPSFFAFSLSFLSFAFFIYFLLFIVLSFLLLPFAFLSIFFATLLAQLEASARLRGGRRRAQ